MSSTTKLVIGALVVAVVSVTGLRACSQDERDPEPSRPAVAVGSTGPDRPIGPTKVVQGVPMGWRHDPAGARGAAMSAVHLTGQVAKAGFITRQDVIGELATEEYGPTLTRSSARQLDDLIADLGTAELVPAQLLWAELPLTAQATRVSNDAVRVDVWSVLIIGAPGVGVPHQAWRTVTLDMAWERGDWRIEEWTDEPGPTPVLDHLTDTASLEQLKAVTAWPSAASTDGST